MTILITGAAGQTSGLVSNAVSPSSLRLLVRSQDSIKKIKEPFLTAPRLVVCHRRLPRSEHAASRAQGSRLGLLQWPRDARVGKRDGHSADRRSKGSKRQAFCVLQRAVPRPHQDAQPQRAASVEEHLIESGLNYTILQLQPTSFMQNINIHQVLSTGVLLAPYSSTTVQGYLERYELTGENCTFNDVARALSQAAHASDDSKSKSRTITVERIERDQVLGRRVTLVNIAGYYDYGAEALDRMMYYYYDKRGIGIPGNSNTIRWLLGREPISWAERIRRDLENGA